MRDVFKRLYKCWLRVGTFLHEVTLAVTFLSFIPVSAFTLYYLLWDFDLCRVIAGAVVFRIMVKNNIEL